jgi:hypothetical protein
MNIKERRKIKRIRRSLINFSSALHVVVRKMITVLYGKGF